MTAPVSRLCPPCHCRSLQRANVCIDADHRASAYSLHLSARSPPYLLGETHCTVKKALPLYDAEATGWMQPGFGGIRLSLTG